MAEAAEISGGKATGVVELTGKIMVIAIILLFFIIVFIFCLHLYAKRYWYRRQETTTATATSRRRHLEFASAASAPNRRGLDPSLLKAIPITLFTPQAFKEGLECAVCLSEVTEGEKARLLPKCNHGFHVDCIDMWFQSHSTCPLCRNPVSNSPVGEFDTNSVAIEMPNFPTNVLIWGNETQVSTFGPCVEEGETSSSSSSSAPSGEGAEGDEQKSVAPTRLRSLKRLLSGNRRVSSPSSPRNLDLEQGVRLS